MRNNKSHTHHSSNDLDFVDLIDTVQSEKIQQLHHRNTIKLEIESKEKKADFFNEMIHIVFYYGNSDSTVSDNKSKCFKEWRIQRYRLTNDFLQQIINRLLSNTKEAGSVISYLRETVTGEIITPDNMQRLCRSQSSRSSKSRSANSDHVKYELFTSSRNQTIDVLKIKTNQSYRGGMKFILYNVPTHSQNSLHEVETDHIRHWIIDGILQEDQSIQKGKDDIVTLKATLDNTITLMRKFANESIMDEKGRFLKGKRAQKKREEKFLELQRKKEALYTKIDSQYQHLQYAKKNTIDKISLSILQHPNKTTWEFRFLGKYKDYFDEIILSKMNWNTSFMYANSSIDSLKDENSRFEDDDFLVDSYGISIKRLEDGFGCFHNKLARDYSDDINVMRNHESHVDAYLGSYQDGNKNGVGIEYSKGGIYVGEMAQDLPCGVGCHIAKDGDVISGSYEINPVFPGNTESKRPNLYTRSSAAGHHNIQFSDGAFYSGEMMNGRISGSGIYVSSQGDILEGQFSNGHLMKGTKVLSGGDIKIIGEFEHGLLEGKGSLECKSMRSLYKGYFVDGSKHGMGEEILSSKKGTLLSKYNGMFVNNKRSGMGEFLFNDTVNPTNTGHLEKEELILDSYWLSGQPKAGGMITKQKFFIFADPTTPNPQSKFRWLHRLKKVQEKKERNQYSYQRDNERSDVTFRNVIETKKKDLFECHRNSILFALRNGIEKNCKNKCGIPSKDQHLIQRKVNKAPETIEDALDKSTPPGLYMVTDSSDENEMTRLQRMIYHTKEKWTAIDVNLLESSEIKVFEQEYNGMVKEWSLIDVDKVDEYIQRPKRIEDAYNNE